MAINLGNESNNYYGKQNNMGLTNPGASSSLSNLKLSNIGTLNLNPMPSFSAKPIGTNIIKNAFKNKPLAQHLSNKTRNIYNLPATGINTATTAAPVSTPNTSSMPNLDINKFYSQALAAMNKQLDPYIQAEIAPVQQSINNLPQVYQSITNSLNSAISGEKVYEQAQIQNLNEEEKIAVNGINTARAQTESDFEAQAARTGMTGDQVRIERAQTNVKITQQLMELDQQTNDKATTLQAADQNTINAYQMQLAQLPLEQQQQALQMATQIAQYKEQGAAAAMGYAAQMVNYAIKQYQFEMTYPLEAERAGAAVTSAGAQATSAAANVERANIAALTPKILSPGVAYSPSGGLTYYNVPTTTQQTFGGIIGSIFPKTSITSVNNQQEGVNNAVNTTTVTGQ